MKTILVPTDFSKNAIHAAEYAAMLANQMHANIVFVNTFNVPMATEYEYANSLENYLVVGKEVGETNLKEFTRNFINKTNFDPDRTAQIVEYGFVSDKIVDIANTIKADFIVMGTKGASNVLDRWFGTTAQTVIKTAKCPVWIIPNRAYIHYPKKILYAADFQEDEIVATHRVLGMAKPLEADCKVVHIHDYFEENTAKIIQQKVNNLQYAFDEENVSFKNVKYVDIIQGLENYIHSYKPDVLALAVHEKSFLSRIFDVSVSKHFIQEAKLPMFTFRS
jgi:nucleotide-binding universal stress UspA family protein